jgi:hypothetical protein
MFSPLKYFKKSNDFFENGIDVSARQTYSQLRVSYSHDFHNQFPADADRRGGY